MIGFLAKSTALSRGALRNLLCLATMAVLATGAAQGLPHLVQGLNSSYAKQIECTSGLANRGYVYCAEYPYEMDVMLLDVPFAIADAGLTGLTIERDRVDITLEGVDHRVSFLPGFLLVRQMSDAARRTVYVIDVEVEPAESVSGPVTLLVLESPDSSKWRPSSTLGTVPGRVVLDREGTWTLKGELNGRLTDTVTISIPEDRQVTLRFP